MLPRIVVLILFAVLTLTAQESTSAIPRNNTALRNAIAGLGKKPLPLMPQQVRIAAPTSGACAVALRAMPIENPEQFTIRQVPAAETAPMPQVALPAPSCETAAR